MTEPTTAAEPLPTKGVVFGRRPAPTLPPPPKKPTAIDAVRETSGMAGPLSDAEYISLGRILERFMRQDRRGTVYWRAGRDTRPYEDGQPGGMTIDMSIVITEEEVALLDRRFEQ